ncbi:hypothetical protein K1719_030396 [Acacia pycnantha]|nr:hypothetical protein K1719_030396 [Acacia pycnantha]
MADPSPSSSSSEHGEEAKKRMQRRQKKEMETFKETQSTKAMDMMLRSYINEESINPPTLLASPFIDLVTSFFHQRLA